MQELGIHLPQEDSSDLSGQSFLKSHCWIFPTQWPLDPQTNSSFVQLCGGKVTGTEGSDGFGMSIGKLPWREMTQRYQILCLVVFLNVLQNWNF